MALCLISIPGYRVISLRVTTFILLFFNLVGIPAVVGIPHATERIKASDHVRVNSAASVVEVLA